MKKFLNGLLSLILIVIIIGGVGYIGYNFLYNNHSSNPQVTDTNNTNSSPHGSNPTHSTNNNQANNNQTTQSNTSEISNIGDATIVLRNKDSLNKATFLLNESIRLMTLDPYSPNEKVEMNLGGQSQADSTDNAQNNNNTDTGSQGNTIINIYPPSDTAGSLQSGSANIQMSNMGVTYDANKMEQLHTGLYKLSVGMQLLEQLNDELEFQAERVNQSLQNPIQYYRNQYNTTVQNKNKINQALNYINNAANLVNINPYVSSNGLVFDKDKMQQIHQSVFKLAQGVGALNKLGDDFTKQAVYIANSMEIYIANANATAQTSHSTTNPGLFSQLFNNIGASTLVNSLLIIFAIAFIFGIIGSVISLIKTPTKKEKPEITNS